MLQRIKVILCGVALWRFCGCYHHTHPDPQLPGIDFVSNPGSIYKIS